MMDIKTEIQTSDKSPGIPGNKIAPAEQITPPIPKNISILDGEIFFISIVPIHLPARKEHIAAIL